MARCGLRRVRAPGPQGSAPGVAAAPRRRHARRQPPLGPRARCRHASGHQAGADKIEELLGWCREAGVEYVTLWLLSTDNLRREQEKLAPLLKIIETAVSDLADSGTWRLTIVGALDLLPAETAESLRRSAQRTADVDGMTVNVAVGYGGRREIADAVRDLLLERAAAGESIEQIAAGLTAEDIAGHLYTRGSPTPTS